MTDGDVNTAASGSPSITSQVSSTRWPVLTPPWKRHASRQAPVHCEIDAVPVLGLDTVILGEREVVVGNDRDLVRIEIVETADGVAAAVRQPRSTGAVTLNLP